LEVFLNRVNRETRVIRLSESFNLRKKERNEPDGLKFYNTMMDYGDKLRQRSKNKAAVASIGVAEILNDRSTFTPETESRSKVYVIRQLKTPEEIDRLREIYGKRFVALSCFASRKNRVDTLSRRLADRAHEIQTSKYRHQAEQLIQRDENDPDTLWGQNTRKAFPNADIFVSADDTESLREQLNRALEVLFDNRHRTPTRDEYGMFLAEAAALRSAALGRQVGAVITTTGGDTISVGTNEVPRAGGGLYWEGDHPDRRDHTFGVDSNDRFKEKLLGEIVRRMQAADWLRKEIKNKDMSTLIHQLLYDDAAILSGSQVDNIIEFGRCVHAEMAAIVDAARRGAIVDGGVLYTTTFPCHECARHIVAAGIRRVVYRVPYPKSLVRELYPDSIDLENEGPKSDKVLFEPFVGIAPRRFDQLFAMRKRKDDKGKVIRWNPGVAQLVLGDYFPTDEQITKDEAAFVAEIASKGEKGND